MFARQRVFSNALVVSRRTFHQVPKLAHQTQFEERGIEGLYSAEGFKSAWLEYQKYLTLNLSLHTTGTLNESKTPYQVLLNTAKQTTEQHIFHYASQAHNNHFFFEQITDKTKAEKTRPSRFFMERLADQDFPTLQSFRDKFLSMAEVAVGQGWIFLVELPDKSFKIMKCGNDGTPYFYGKNQSLDLNGAIEEASFHHLNDLKQKATRNDRDFTLPLLALNYWDMSYITDYGVTGKSKYLENCWNCINWDVVNKRLFQI